MTQVTVYRYIVVDPYRGERRQELRQSLGFDRVDYGSSLRPPGATVRLHATGSSEDL
jgi:hypothetical protein